MQMEMIKRSFPCEIKEINEQDRTIWFVASTEDRDRCGDVIRVAGWDFAAYDKNPVFLWAHSRYELPLGKCIEHRIESTRLLMRIQFATAAENPFAEQVFRLYRGGFLSGVSVGFRPIERQPLDPNDRWGDYGWEFIKQELLELSGCSVPANPATLQLMAKALDLQEGEPLRLTPEQRVALPPLEKIEPGSEFLVGISLSRTEHKAFQKYGPDPAAWLSNFESLKDLADHLKDIIVEKKLGKGRRAELGDIADKMEHEYKALAGACDDLVEKCKDRIRKILDDMEPTDPDDEEPEKPKAFDEEAFRREFREAYDHLK
jgi:HK97 family phage prohead protease